MKMQSLTMRPGIAVSINLRSWALPLHIATAEIGDIKCLFVTIGPVLIEARWCGLYGGGDEVS